MPDPTRTVAPPPATDSVADPNATTGGEPPTVGSPSPASHQRYVVGEEIARGGMGEVYRATDTVLGREVAVKVLQPKYHPESATARRFHDEARIAAQLQHPGIPAVHDVGTLPDGRPFLAMKLIRGDTLDDLLKRRPPPADDRGRFLAVFEHICHALAYAHAHGVIHRDLKPQNVMVGSFNEVQVMDWGLAKVLASPELTVAGDSPDPDATHDLDPTEIKSLRDSDDLRTQAGSILGTPAFMAPEQAIGAVDKIDRRTDVFGLGAILAVVLTGQPPFRGGSKETMRVKAAQGDVADCFARLDGCDAEPELVALCKRCLSPKPADRPANAGEVADAVAALRAAADDRARQAEIDREKATVQAAEQRKRRRVQLALAAAAAGLLLTVGVGVAVAVLWQRAERAKGDAETAQGNAEQARDAEKVARQEADTARDKESVARGEAEKQKGEAERQKGEAEKQRAEADRERDKFERFEYGRKMQMAYQQWTEHNLQATVAMLDDTNPKLRGWEWQYVKSLCDTSRLTLRGHKGRVWSADWSPDGKQIMTTGDDGTLRVWDAERGVESRTLKANVRTPGFPNARGAWWSADQKHVVAIEKDGTVKRWATADWTEKTLLAVNRDKMSGAEGVLHRAKNRLLIAVEKSESDARILDLDTGEEVVKLNDLSGKEEWGFARWSPDGRTLFTVEREIGRLDRDRAKLWDAETGKVLPLPKSFEGTVHDAGWSPNGKRLYTRGNGRNGTDCIWDVESDSLLHELGHLGWTEWNRDGNRLLTSGGRKLRVWNLRSGEAKITLDEGDFPNYLIRWSPDGSKFMTASANGKRLRVWDANTGTELLSLIGHTSVITSAEWSPDGKWILTAGSDGTARVWDATAKPVGQTMDGRATGFWGTGPQIKERIDTFVCPVTEKACEVWEAETGSRLMTLDVSAAQVAEVRRSHDGKRVLVARASETEPVLEVWDVNPPRRVHRFPGFTLQRNHRGWSPTGRFVSGVAADNTAVRVWEAESGKQVMAANGLVPNPDQWTSIRPHWEQAGGRLFVEVRTGQYPKQQTEYREWRTDTWAEVKHTPGVQSPDGKREVMNQGLGGKWALVDRANGRVIRTLDAWNWCWWSPDSKQFILRDNSRTLRVCDADTGDELFTLADHPAEVYRCDWSPDGRFIGTAAGDTVLVWDAKTGERVQTVSQVPKVDEILSWSPDGRRLMIGTWYGNDPMNIPLRLVVADLTGEKRVRRLPGGHTHKLTTAEWSQDGTRILTAGGDNSVRVWDPESGAELLALKEPLHWVEGHWSKDGSRVISYGWPATGNQQTLTVYDMIPKNGPK